MNNIVQDLEPLKDKLRNHSLYNNIKDVEDLKIFSSAHVYAVWDFMSLLKFLQIKLTSTSLPWFPSKNTTTAKLINEIYKERRMKTKCYTYIGVILASCVLLNGCDN